MRGGPTSPAVAVSSRAGRGGTQAPPAGRRRPRARRGQRVLDGSPSASRPHAASAGRRAQHAELLAARRSARGQPCCSTRPRVHDRGWLMSAEHVMPTAPAGHPVERGIRTFGPTRANARPDAIPVVKELSHLPVIVDPSHAPAFATRSPDVPRRDASGATASSSRSITTPTTRSPTARSRSSQSSTALWRADPHDRGRRGESLGRHDRRARTSSHSADGGKLPPVRSGRAPAAARPHVALVARRLGLDEKPRSRIGAGMCSSRAHDDELTGLDPPPGRGTSSACGPHDEELRLVLGWCHTIRP